MIEVKQDLDSLSYDTGIEIKIISENFDSTEKFGKLTSSQLDTIMMADSSLNRENILVAFLYINSYIGCRPRQNDESEYENAKDNPEAFYRSIKHMSEELSMSKDTINQCIGYLTKSIDSVPALLITHTSHTKIRHTTRNYVTLGIWKRFFQFSGSLLIKRDTSSAIWHSDAL